MTDSTVFKIGVAILSLLSTSLAQEDRDAVLPRKDAPDFVARILPLGASIVWGYETPEGNGFRQPLHDELASSGWNVNMVGSKQHGTMSDNYVEAHPGDTIDQIHKASSNSIKYQPNIIVINGGVNDCHQHIKIPEAGVRMNNMLDDLYAKIPGTTIILSTLVLSTDKEVEKDRGNVNDQYRALVKDRREKKDRIVLAEMTGKGDAFVQVADLNKDGIHPTDQGHLKMAHIFYQAIVQANAEGLLTGPKQSDSVPDEGKKPSTITTTSAITTSSITATSSTTASTTKTSATSTSTPTTTVNPTTSTSSSTLTSTATTTTTVPTTSSTSSSFGAILHTKTSNTDTVTTPALSAVTNNAVTSVPTSIMTVTSTTSSAPSGTKAPSTTSTAGIQSVGSIKRPWLNGCSVYFIAVSSGLYLGLNLLH